MHCKNFLTRSHSFVNEAQEQYEVLQGMSQKMSTLFKAMSKYLTFDPKKYTMDEFFGDVNTFIKQFTVSRCIIEDA